MRLFYFGCIGEAGHYFWDHNLNYAQRKLANFPIPWEKVDGVLCPQTESKNGVVKIHHKNGWTAAAFWDQSVDHRPNSNSVFFAEGVHGVYHMIEFIKKNFPSIYKRFDFKLVEFITPKENEGF